MTESKAKAFYGKGEQERGAGSGMVLSCNRAIGKTSLSGDDEIKGAWWEELVKETGPTVMDLLKVGKS